MPKKLTFAYVQKFIEDIGYKLVSPEYKNNREKLQVDCNDGHIFAMNFNDIKTGHKCPYCAKRRVWDSGDIINAEFGRLIVTSYEGRYRKSRDKEHFYNCQCQCGNNVIVSRTNLLTSNTKSCGCIKEDGVHKLTHGKSKTKLHWIYQAIKDRCLNENSDAYKNYGGRGIKIGEEWLGDNGFINFYEWSINNGYSEGLTIDRINNDGRYHPKNCRWTTRKVQAENTRKSVKVKAVSKDGRVLFFPTVTSCSEFLGIGKTVISNALNGIENIQKEWKFYRI